MGSGLQQVRSMAAQGGALYGVNFPTGIRKSTDAGATWSPTNTGLPVSGSNIFAESVGAHGTFLFAGTHAGVFRSGNGGAGWSSVNGSLTASSTIFANKFFSFGNQLFAVFSGTIANGGGIHRTSDNGGQWNIGHSGMGSNATVHHLSQVGATLYASTSVGLYQSSDQGQNWTPLPSVNFAVFGLAGQGGNLVIATAFGCKYSTNNGTTWTDATGGPGTLSDAELIAFDGQLFLAAANSTGMYRSQDNGMSWQAYNSGIAPIDLVTLEEFMADGNTLYVGAFQGIYAIQGSSVGLADAETAHEGGIHPTVLDREGWLVHLQEGTRTVELRLLDAQGRVAYTERVQGPGPHRVAPALAAGRYHALVADEQGPRPLGTVVVP